MLLSIRSYTGNILRDAIVSASTVTYSAQHDHADQLVLNFFAGLALRQ